MHSMVPFRERKDFQNHLLHKRFQKILPQLWNKKDFDAWLIIGSEYNEDPVLLTMLPQTTMNAARTTAILISRNESEKPKIFSSVGSRFGDFFQNAWPIQKEEFWECLERVVRDSGIKRLGLNYSSSCRLADGISHSLFEEVRSAIPDHVDIVSAEKMASDWLQLRTEEEIEVLRFIDAIAHRNISEVFLRSKIRPGITCTEELEWLLREKALEDAMNVWFQPEVDFQRFGEKNPQTKGVIEFGDLLHCDYGLDYLGLKSDTQRLFYVLKKEEQVAPYGLQRALLYANRLQDIVVDQFRVGTTGNEVLLQSLGIAREKGLFPMVYTHPIGFHGHGAGPTIGLWNCQSACEGPGEWLLTDQTAYALELNCRTEVPEWNNQSVMAYLEETVLLTEGAVDFLDGRQTELFSLPTAQ